MEDLMAVVITHPLAHRLAVVCTLHESVIGGFWQDLADVVPGWAGSEEATDELGVQLYEIASSSGLSWPVRVPRLDWWLVKKQLFVHGSAHQVKTAFDLYAQVRAGRWSAVATLAHAQLGGSLATGTKQALGKARGQVLIQGWQDDPLLQAAEEASAGLQALLST